MTSVNASERAALLRVCVSIESGKRPSAQDARVAVAFIRQVIDAPRKPFQQEPRHRPGRPARIEARGHKKETYIDRCLKLYSHAGRREPESADFLAIAKDCRISDRTLRRCWDDFGEIAKKLATIAQLPDDFARTIPDAQAAFAEIGARYVATVKDLMQDVGKDVLTYLLTPCGNGAMSGKPQAFKSATSWDKNFAQFLSKRP